MIALLQRVSYAEVTVKNQITGEIDQGLLIFIGVFNHDTEKDVQFLVDKISGFRIFNDENDKMNLSVQDVKGSVLVVSQFTLCADWKKGRRPSFIRAATPEKGEQLYNEFINHLSQKGIHVESGSFGAMMDVKLTNDGPATFVLDTNNIH
ncbi:MAG: D-tyrosyl-tRNA(Tyr) deacylase [Candidatus Marinimicrobia bacterium]|nr:D-tyrosyl-tRNA(Tyr) deacylase [Candidatus Neomarinimicrobiota bacterium]